MSGYSNSSRTSPRTAVSGAGGVVLNRAGKVLVLGHSDGAWVFPKGHVEQDETSQAAALREVKEEAGVEAELLPGSATWTTSYRNPRGVPREITWYACVTDAEAVHLTERVFPRGGFYEPARALELLTHTSDKELLLSVLEAVEPQLRSRS